MRRRKFITLLGGAVVWPAVAWAQQPGIRRVAVIMPAPQDDQDSQGRLAAFIETLARLGWSDGRNVRLDVRWAGGDIKLYNAFAMDLATGSPSELIVTSGNPLLTQLQSQIKTIPIVFTGVSDPVGGGFVSNVARPGGNVTGFENFQPDIGGKWLGLLKEVDPGVTRVGILLHPETSAHVAFQQVIEAASPPLALRLTAIGVHDAFEIERSLAKFAEEPNGGLIVLPHPILNQNRDLIIALAGRYRLPAIYPFRYFASSGGLISYGTDPVEQWRGAAGYVDRILKGEKPGDLPVQALSKYELIINLKTAKAIGLDVPAQMLNRADKVIE
jgi:putative tryptophan/tyrosine transport system substrate-binding protein